VSIAIAEPPRETSPSFALSRLLDELSTVVAELPVEIYCAGVAHGVSGSVGEHVRHCLDHISALLAAGASATLSYDHRQRGTAIETDPGAALQHILRLQVALERWPSRSLDAPIRVSSVNMPGSAPVAGWSTLARELAFVVNHTVHHQAIIALVLRLHGLRVPDRFGHSPSTPRRN
jgi:uncharacterized damage-inducible protein DinB